MDAINNRLDLKGIVVLLVLCVSWGIQQVTIKIAIAGVSPILQSGIRSFGASLIVLAYMIWRKQPVLDRDKTLWWGLAAGILFSFEFMLIYWGLEFTHASRAVIFLYLSPFVVAVGAQIFIPGDSLNRYQAAGLLLAFLGIVVAFSESMSLPERGMLIGDTMLVGAAVLWGAVTILIKAGPLASIAPAKTLLYQLGVSALVLPAGSLIFGEAGITRISLPIAACILYQVVWVASITYLAWFWLISCYSVSRLASFTFLTPLFGVLAGWAFLNEPITAKLMISLILVVLGIYLVNRPRTAREVNDLYAGPGHPAPADIKKSSLGTRRL